MLKFLLQFPSDATSNGKTTDGEIKDQFFECKNMCTKDDESWKENCKLNAISNFRELFSQTLRFLPVGSRFLSGFFKV